MRNNAKRYVVDVLVILGGAVLMSLAVNLFLRPSGIVTGGVTGLAMMSNALWPRLPVGVMIFTLNLPLFALGFKLLNARLIWWTLLSVACNSILIDLGGGFLNPIDAEPVIAAVFGGLLLGLGLGLVFLRGATTGGSDIAAKLLQLKIPHLSVGKLVLVVDVFVISLSALVFGSIGNTLYAAVTLFVSSRVIDAVLYGPDAAGVAHVISDQPEAVAKAVSQELGRGTTLLHGQGGLDGAPKKVVLCAVHRTQLPLLRRVVAEVDPRAFVILSEAHEVRGLGFQPLEK